MHGSEFIQFLSELFKLKVGVHHLADAFAAMALDLAAHSFVKALLTPHGGEGMAGIVRGVFAHIAAVITIFQDAHIAQDRGPVGVNILAVVGIESEAGTVALGDEVFVSLAHPMPEEGEYAVVNRNLTNSVIVLTFIDIERFLLKVYAGALYGEQLARADSCIDEHKDQLDVFIVR